MSQLPPAIPPFMPDVDTAYAELGKAMAYIKQLTTLIQQRAQEANEMHDELIAARDRIAALESRIAVLTE